MRKTPEFILEGREAQVRHAYEFWLTKYPNEYGLYLARRDKAWIMKTKPPKDKWALKFT